MELLFSEVTLFGLLTANVFDDGADTEFDPLFVVAAAAVVVVIVAVVPCD